MSERIYIRLARWNTANAGIKKYNTDDEEDDDDEDENDVEMTVEETDKSCVRRLAAGSAELIEKLQGVKVGEGGQNTWGVYESSDDEEMDQIEIIKETKTEKKIVDNIGKILH